MGSVWIEFIVAENWKHCSEIIFKCVNSIVGPILIFFIRKQCMNSVKQCVNSKPMWGYCSRAGKKKKKKKKAENVDAAKRQETRKPNTHMNACLVVQNSTNSSWYFQQIQIPFQTIKNKSSSSSSNNNNNKKQNKTRTKSEQIKIGR